MFNKLKQLKELRDQAKKLENMLAGESATNTRNGVTVVINGKMKVEKITIDEDLPKEKLQEILKDCVNSAMEDMQKIMARKMQEAGGIPGMN